MVYIIQLVKQSPSEYIKLDYHRGFGCKKKVKKVTILCLTYRRSTDTWIKNHSENNTPLHLFRI